MQTEKAPDAIREEAPFAGEPDAMDVDKPNTDSPETDNPEADPSPAIDAAGVMMRADYQRKTAELARQKAEVEAREARLAYLAEYEQTIDEEEAARIRARLDGRGGATAPDPNVLALRGEVAQLKQERFFEALDTTANRVAKEYGMTRDEMVALVREEWDDGAIHPGVNPAALEKRITKAAKAAGYDKAKKAGGDEVVQRLKDKAKIASPRGSGTTPQSAEPDTSKMTDRERQAYMLSLVKGSR